MGWRCRRWCPRTEILGDHLQESGRRGKAQQLGEHARHAVLELAFHDGPGKAAREKGTKQKIKNKR